ncbi:MAG: NPCBM/NEW2 domain-containing protein [Tepidisphaeraceae bacterium]
MHRPIEALEPRRLLASVRIMPLGDSITEGYSPYNSYRYWLWNKLNENHYDVNFVGSMHGVNGGPPRFSNWDQDHEGHAGWTADDIADRAQRWATDHEPDIVLLHIGTNDIFAGQSAAGIIVDVSDIIDALRRANPRITVLLAKIIPDQDDAAAIAEFDSKIPALASRKNSSSSRVLVVDQPAGFNVARDTYDGIHPDASGEQKLANHWFAALRTVLATTSPPPEPSPSITFLSNLTPFYARNGAGPYARNRSNGGSAVGDGKPITLNSKRYTHGLGVHAVSDLRYDLAGKYRTFQADIGVDDEVATLGSVGFRVLADDVKIYDSGKMTGESATKSIKLNVAGRETLRLLVIDYGDGTDHDHADWADARLTTLAVESHTMPFGAVPLSSLEWSSPTNAFGPPERDHSNGDNAAGDGRTISIDGTAYVSGVGVHASSRIAYYLNGRYSTFATDIGVDDEAGAAASVIFKIYADGRNIFSGQIMRKDELAKSVLLSVRGVQKLILVVEDAGDGNTDDHADWANARLYV